jgi:addiction module HigA family antidote
MLRTKRKPVSVGKILQEEFIRPMGLDQVRVAAAMGVERKQVNRLCRGKLPVTVPTALMLARVFENSPDFWLNLQRATDLWNATHSKKEMERIGRARPIAKVAKHPEHA